MQRLPVTHLAAVVNDTTADDGLGRYALYRIYRQDTTILHVQVRRELNAACSIAMAKRLAPGRRWILVATESGTRWHQGTSPWGKRATAGHPEPGFEVLRRIADELVRLALHGVA